MARDLQLSIRRKTRYGRNPYRVQLVKNSWHGMNFTTTGHEFIASNGVTFRSTGNDIAWFKDRKILCIPSRQETSRVLSYDYTNTDHYDALAIREAYAEYRRLFCRGGRTGVKKEEKEDIDRTMYHLRLGIGRRR